MKLKTPDFKKHIKKHGVTKARISEDYMDYKAGDIFTFGIGITIEGKRYSKTTLVGYNDNSVTFFGGYKGTFEIEPDGTAVEEEEELSKCCGSIASWDFSFKSCKKCGKRFEPKHIHQMDTSEEHAQKSEDIGGEEFDEEWEKNIAPVPKNDENGRNIKWLEHAEKAKEDIKAYIKDNYIRKDEVRESLDNLFDNYIVSVPSPIDKHRTMINTEQAKILIEKDLLKKLK